jgi:glycyl-tRNA synthetase
MQKEDNLKDIISHAKEYGFVFPSSEIYDGLAATYDYGQLGSELKNNIKSYWWKSMVQMRENVVGIDSAIFMHPGIWKASGHVDAFNDPLIDNKDSKKRYRADVLLEEYIEKIQGKINKEVAKGLKRFGDDFNKEEFLKTNPNVLRSKTKIEDIENRMRETLGKNDLEGVYNLIVDLEIACPVSGSKNWTEVRQFNLMFSTELGSVAGDASTLYLRPETAQGIFVNFLNVPFGIAQIGKAFRNEIVARQFIFRMREFEQMEMQFFIRPGEQEKWYEYWKQERINWHLALGIPEESYRFHDHIKLAHYADAASDIEFNFPMGFKELEGVHSRTDFDLKQHEAHSGKKLQYFDPELNKNYVPYVIETSIGLDRMFLAVLSSSFNNETLEDGSSRAVLALPPALAPYKVAVMPLTKKDGLPDKAREIMDELKLDFNCAYDEKDSPGKRYRRQDAIGTPFCIMVDHQALEDDTVTIRDRDTMLQERVPISELKALIAKRVSFNALLSRESVSLQS